MQSYRIAIYVAKSTNITHKGAIDTGTNITVHVVTIYMR